MLLSLAARVRVLFVGGKGGVGKTSTASAVALAAAREGRRVLVASTDPAHNLGHLWDRPVGDDVVRLAGPFPVGQDGGAAGTGVGHLDGIEIDPERTAERHLDQVRGTLHRLMPEHLRGEVDRHLDLARHAPGAHEAALLERVAETVELGLAEYDLVVFDTAPSGHTARLMALPEAMSAWTDGLLRGRDRSARFGDAARRLGHTDDDGAGVLGTGSRARDRRERRDQEIRAVLERRRRRFAGLREVLTDHGRTAFVIVLAAERMPVLEALELHRQLEATGVGVRALVVNKRSPHDGGDLLAARHAQEERHLAVVRDALPRVPLLEVPLLPGDLAGEAALTRLGELLR
ncbi:ArsA family ATPase [Xylanimonas oleitrophica]|uniref:ArsA family ATPase n=1 Tax=Xylanimonas oleitrophica TaxID=2607479 RepID=A0A2W5YCB9_9MICO|nr:ArsA family ATPase [Xylanimonas oleitrophica]PZR51751.1 ArsA family ATPase [Xylanimonas oleitrophica]